MKKLGILLMTMATMCALAISASAVDVTVSELATTSDTTTELTITEGQMDNVAWQQLAKFTALTDLTIEDNVTILSMLANKIPTSVVNVTIEPDITGGLPNSAFLNGYTNLKSVNLGGVTVIGTQAFRNCNFLENVSAPNAQNIGASSFVGCTMLKTVNFSAVKEIPNSLFQDCTALEAVTLTAAETLGTNVFIRCASLKEVSLPEATSVGTGSFSGCVSLENVSLPEVTVAGGLFTGCTNLVSVSLPKVTNIANSMFSNCAKLTSITLTAAETLGTNVFQGCEKLSAIDLPEATSVGTGSFSGCISLEKAELPKVKIIPNGLFQDCTALETVTLTAAETLGTNVFIRCASLKEISLPEATSVGLGSFTNCAVLKSVNLPEVTAIPNNLFQNCTLLESVTLTDAVTLGTNVFNGCSKLGSIDLPNATLVGTGSFTGCVGLETINMAKVTDIPEGLFQFCESLTSASLPEVTTLGANAFRFSPLLTTVDAPKTTNVGKGAFLECYAFTTLTAQAVESIGEYAFKSCYALESFSTTENIATLKEACFYDCKNLKTVTIPGVTELEPQVFADCVLLDAVNFPAVETIGHGAFAGCTSLTEINLPKATKIGWSWNEVQETESQNDTWYEEINLGVFQGCTNLTTINLPVASYIGCNTFNDCSVTTLILPATPPSVETSYGTPMGTNDIAITLVDAEGTVLTGDALDNAKLLYDGVNAWKPFFDVIVDTVLDAANTALETVKDVSIEDAVSKQTEINTAATTVVGLNSETLASNPDTLDAVNKLDALYVAANDVTVDTVVTALGVDSADLIQVPAANVQGLALATQATTDIALVVDQTNCISNENVDIAFTAVPMDDSENVIPNDNINAPVTFRVNLPESFSSAYANVVHYKTGGGEESFRLPVQDDNGTKYIVITVTGFSTFEVTAYVSSSSGVSSFGVSVSEPTGCDISVSSSKVAMGKTVTITADLADGYTLVAYKHGDKELALTDLGGGKYSFVMPGTSVVVTAIAAEKEEEPEAAHPFVDVDENAYYYDAMLWALEQNITAGTTDTTFAPGAPCTRGQIVTFLYRAAGSPAVTGDTDFVDVDEDAYYHDAMVWAVKNGITAGTSATTFDPSAPCTRGQIVTFLWRAAGTPDVSGSALDVNADSYCYDAVIWAVDEGITTGYAGGTFGAPDACNRGQIVTFLYRYMGE